LARLPLVWTLVTGSFVLISAISMANPISLGTSPGVYRLNLSLYQGDRANLGPLPAPRLGTAITIDGAS